METVGCYYCSAQNTKLVFRDPETNCTVAKCKACGAYYTRDRLSEEEVNRLYTEDKYYTERCVASWTEEWLPSQHSELEHIERIVSSKGKLLDIGCGGGAFVYTAQNRGWEAFGVDLSQAGIDRARDFWGLNEDIVSCRNIYSMDSKKIYNVITTFHVLEHLYKPLPFLSKIQDLLVDDGLFVVAVPNYGSVDARTDSVIRNTVMDLPFHVIHFTPKSLEMLLRDNGFKVVRKKFFPSQWLITLIKSFKYPIKSNNIQSKEYSGKSEGLQQMIHRDKNKSSKVRILNILSKFSPGSYMVYYARKNQS